MHELSIRIETQTNLLCYFSVWYNVRLFTLIVAFTLLVTRKRRTSIEIGIVKNDDQGHFRCLLITSSHYFLLPGTLIYNFKLYNTSQLNRN